MKRFIAGLILTFTLVSISQAVWAGNSQNAVTIQDQYYQKGWYTPLGQVMCSQDMKSCVVGKYSLRTNGQASLQVSNGMLCTSDGRMCTNGNIIFKNGRIL